MVKTLFAGLLAVSLTFGFPGTLFAQSSPLLSGKILFSSNRTGSWNIFRKDLSTGLTENLTNSLYDNLNPQVSPDRKYIVFYSNRDGNNQIYRMNLADKSVTRLTSNRSNEFDPKYSPNGKSIAFKSNLDDGRGDIWIMNFDGTNRRNLTPSLGATEEWNPTFSRDGLRVYFVSGLQSFSEIRVISSTSGDSSGIYGLTFNQMDDWYPSIHPKTGILAIAGREPGGTRDALFTLTANGKTRTRLTNLIGDSNDPAWSSDGKRILFVNNQYGEYDLFIMNADGTGVTLIEHTPGSELCPIFLPA